MRKYLSKYWVRSCSFCILVVLIIVTTTILFFFHSYSGEDYILIIGSLFFALVFAFLIRISLIMVRYTKKAGNRLIMYSHRNRIICELFLEQNVYYEIMTLIESTSTTLHCVILSNERFDSYQEHGESKLAAVCKSVDRNGRQIIIPYDDFAELLISQPNYFKIV